MESCRDSECTQDPNSCEDWELTRVSNRRFPIPPAAEDRERDKARADKYDMGGDMKVREVGGGRGCVTPR